MKAGPRRSRRLRGEPIAAISYLEPVADRDSTFVLFAGQRWRKLMPRRQRGLARQLASRGDRS